MISSPSYAACLANSQQVAWTIEEVLGGRQLDFGQNFLPDSLARSEELSFLSPSERRLHNQIRGHGYLATFGLVEEFILPFLLEHSQQTDAIEVEQRKAALANFAAEEAKHIDLFKRFRRLFEQGFGRACSCIGPADEIAHHVLSQPALGVSLMILHIEWMTLEHYIASVRGKGEIDPMFRDLLRFHWLEESQHAKMDWLVVQELAAGLSQEEIEAGFQAYVQLLHFFDQGMRGQAGLDLAGLKQSVEREWSPDEEDYYLESQHAALRWTFVRSGMLNETFLQLVESLRPGSSSELANLAEQLETTAALAA